MPVDLAKVILRSHKMIDLQALQFEAYDFLLRDSD